MLFMFKLLAHSYLTMQSTVKNADHRVHPHGVEFCSRPSTKNPQG